MIKGHIESELIRDIYDHEVLITFDEDSEAYYFQDWLEEEGFKLFNKWAEANNER